jgi:polysaccharide pyruvyl transferase CsaB
VNYFLSGYYGYGNAGDEAVLAAILEAISTKQPGATFTVTSGDPEATTARYNTEIHRVRAIARQEPRALAANIRSCDVFISGGGSLLQDVTSVRNIVYYTSLIRFAQLARKPVMVYAQGIGPLARPISQKLARASVQLARAVTVRDEASKQLLQRIGVSRKIEVTADPVWALKPTEIHDSGNLYAHGIPNSWKTWGASLRPWHGYEYDITKSSQIADGLQSAAREGPARFRFVPMQAAGDREVMQNIVQENRDALLDTSNLHPREIMALCGRCDVMIGMRLHALIFAAAQSVPCVAVNYDPKVEALAKIIGAPLLQDLSGPELAKLPAAIASAKPIDEARLAQLKKAALSNAEIATSLR